MRPIFLLGIPFLGMMAGSAFGALGDYCYPRNYPDADMRTWIQGRDCSVNFSGVDEVTIKDRCWQTDSEFNPADPLKDHLYAGVGVGRGITRGIWAVDCKYAPEKWLQMFTHYNFNGQWLPREREQYPTFAFNNKAEGYPIWKPESRAPGFPNKATSCTKPAEVIWLTMCDAGCYDRSMQVLFEDGYKSMEDAMESRSRIMTLKDDATFQNLEFGPRDLESITRDAKEVEQKIYKLTMESGGVLKVTGNHPLLLIDGTMGIADSLSIGTELVQDSGLPDAIRTIEVYTASTRTFNVTPKADTTIGNVVVAEGYLNGSQNFQDKTFRDLNRLVVRQNIPADLL